MRFFKRFRFLKILLLVLFIANLLLVIFDYTHIYKALRYNFVDVDDHQLFNNRTIPASSIPQPWPLAKNYTQDKLPTELQATLDSLESIAFVVIQHDSLSYEYYWEGWSDSSHTGSFSVAKSFIGTLIGIAHFEGKIKSLDQPVADYLPDFAEGDKEKITIRHVLQMSSGLSWDESYAGPFSITTKAYYGKDLRKLIREQEVIEEPGAKFKYLSGDTQVLSFVLKAATGKTAAEYAAEKLWEPMGFEQDAWWSLDKEEGDEKAYCCISTNATDFARLGQLFLDHGNWKGKKIVDSAFVAEATSPNDYTKESCDYYGYQWWIFHDSPGPKTYYARGILGQYIIVIPELDLVAVRLGELRGEKVNQIHPAEMYDMVSYLADTYKNL